MYARKNQEYKKTTGKGRRIDVRCPLFYYSTSFSFPFTEAAVLALFGAGASSPSPSSTSSSPSPSFPSSLVCPASSFISTSSSSSLSTTLLLFFDNPNGPASGISGGDLLLLAVSVINQSNFWLRWR
ncbi:hypothetical protein C8R41DRAFT_913708 [Lentinula lateritia]|uniref:Uncharacterized protein n=1 Tax=Lentinula lateritia TaxID=40482 RepID=A0ABQ8VXL9_9AGAR|nr:hypothetical protein C8R41DRAFT_913708 [Lentinula lateritia]